MDLMLATFICLIFKLEFMDRRSYRLFTVQMSTFSFFCSANVILPNQLVSGLTSSIDAASFYNQCSIQEGNREKKKLKEPVFY